MLIGLTGLAGSGKTTIAQWLVEKYFFERHSFATPLKEMAKAIYKLTDAQVYGDEKDVSHLRNGATPRSLLQHLGTDVCRKHLGQDVWVNAAVVKLLESTAAHQVLDDVRFLNEAEAIQRMGGIVVRVTVTGEESPQGSHVSETEQRAIDADLIIPCKRGGDLLGAAEWILGDKLPEPITEMEALERETRALKARNQFLEEQNAELIRRVGFER